MWPIGLGIYQTAHGFIFGIAAIMIFEVIIVTAFCFFLYYLFNNNSPTKQDVNEFSNVIFDTKV